MQRGEHAIDSAKASEMSAPKVKSRHGPFSLAIAMNKLSTDRLQLYFVLAKFGVDPDTDRSPASYRV